MPRESFTIPDDDTEEDGEDDKLKRLQSFLGMDDTRIEEKRGEIEEKRGKKRKRSPSRSVPKLVEVGTSKKLKHALNYPSPSGIAKIFRNKITPEALCQLSALSYGTPSDVRRIIPTASVEQICDMCELWERSRKYGDEQRKPSKGPKRGRRKSSKHHRRAQPRTPPRPRSSRTSVIKHEEEEKKHKKDAQEDAFPIPTPKKSE